MEKIDPQDMSIDKINEMHNSITKLINSTAIEQAIQSNELNFTFDNVQYKVKRPTFALRQEVYKKQAHKYTELIKDKNFLFEDDLKRIYKDRGMDIDGLVKEIDDMEKRKNEMLYKLGEDIKNQKAEVELERTKKEIEEFTSKQQKLIIRKSSLFENTIETQIQLYIYSYMTYLITDRFVPGKEIEEGKVEAGTWVKAWDSYESFTSSAERLVNTVLFYASLLIKNVIEF